jgi:hypothetical protein
MIKLLKKSPTEMIENDIPGNTHCGGRLSTVDLLIKVACFVEM